MQIDDDFILAALLAANPKFERALIILKGYRAPSDDVDIWKAARSVTGRMARRLGIIEPAFHAFWWRWIKFHEKHGAIHQWTSE